MDATPGRTTVAADPAPVLTATTLAAAMSAGIAGDLDGVTYGLADGDVSTASVLEVYVASAPLPNRPTPMYRAFFGLNGSVCAANLAKAGTVIGSGPGCRASPGGNDVVDARWSMKVRLNDAATRSLQSASAPCDY